MTGVYQFPVLVLMDRTILWSLYADQEEERTVMDIAMKLNAVLGMLKVEMKISYTIRSN